MFREYDRGRSGHKLIIEYRRIKQRYLHYLCLYALFTINNIKEGGRNYEKEILQVLCSIDADYGDDLWRRAF